MRYFDKPAKYHKWRQLNVDLNTLTSYDYVRESSRVVGNPVAELGKRTRTIWGDQLGRIVGYAVIGKPRPYEFDCLVWWLKTYDRPVCADSPYKLTPEEREDPKWKHWGPAEAVAPSRVIEHFPELVKQIQIYRDAASILLRNYGKEVSVMSIFRELFADTEHTGWDTELTLLMDTCQYLAASGYVYKRLNFYKANGKTASIFGRW